MFGRFRWQSHIGFVSQNRAEDHQAFALIPIR
jgi:hypothetical protein